MAEWLNTSQMARVTNYSASSIASLASSGLIPPEHVRIASGKYRDYYQISTDAIPLLIERKKQWHAELVSPKCAKYTPDPNGEYLGFELTPDEAARLVIIRMYHRLYPTTQERNEAMRGDG